MKYKSYKFLPVALSATFLVACVPDPWSGTIQFGETSRHSSPTSIIQLPSDDLLTVTSNGAIYRVSKAGEVLWWTPSNVDGLRTKRMVTDSEENAYIIGYTSTTSGRDTSLAKVDSDGIVIWTRHFTCETGGDAEAMDITLGSEGTLYAQLGIICDDFLATEKLGQIDSAILKLDSSSGELIWIKRQGDQNLDIDLSSGNIAYSNSGHIISVTTQLAAQPTARIQKINTEGEVLAEQAYAGMFATTDQSAIDSEDNLYISGQAFTDTFFDQTLMGDTDFFVLKINAELGIEWARTIGSEAMDIPETGVTLDNAGNVYVGGVTRGSVLGSGNQGGQDALISKWNADGEHQWVVQLGTESIDSATALTSSRNGGIFITGHTSGDLVPNAGSGENLFIAKLKADGSIVGDN